MLNKMKCFQIIFTILVLNIREYRFQQIFSSKRSFCTFKNDEMPKHERVVEVEHTFWDIVGSSRDSRTHVLLSLCATLPTNSNCDPNAAICIFNDKRSIRNIRNAGEHFVYKNIEGKNVLQSVNGQKCYDGTENFTVTIQFERNPKLSSTPKFLFMDECELKLEMMWPKYTPPCTVREDGNLIDLRPLQKLENFLVYEPVDKKNYSLSICKKSALCQEDISVCEITEMGTFPIGSVNTERITYDERHGLVIKSQYGQIKSNKRLFQLNLKCNWKSQGVTNLTAMISTGRTRRFNGESSLACIKFPTNCLVRDNNLVYDLRRLNKTYEVKNVTAGIIKINVCDVLIVSREEGDCAERHSQVCYHSNTNEMKSLGGIPKNFQVTLDDTVRGTFEDGSICAANKNFTYSTEIEFICKFTEDGPIVKDIVGCTYKIKWFTPAACPINNPLNDNCVIHDWTGTVNLQKLYKDDRQMALSQNSFLRYNLCGPLNSPCGNNSDAAVCYVEGEKERVVGLLSKSLIIEDNVISLNMPVEKYKRNTCRTKVKFYCNHMIKPDQEANSVNIERDKCNFVIFVETPLACGTYSEFNCTFENGNLLYNLNGISKNDGNYLIQDGNNHYFINLCRSIVKTNDALCPTFSGICMKDLDEPHLKFRYKSLGLANANMAPTFERDDLIITYEQGSFCEEADSLARSSRISFQCSTNEEGPQLVNKSACHYEFRWRTPHACPTKKKTAVKSRAVDLTCQHKNTQNGKIIDLSDLNYSFHFEGLNRTIYQLKLCTSTYSECRESNCTTKNAEYEFISNTSRLYLSYILNHKCYPNKDPNHVHVHLTCDPEDGLEMDTLTNCTLNLNLKTSVVCDTKVLHADEPYSNSELQQMNSNNLKNTKVLHADEPHTNSGLQKVDLSNLKNAKVIRADESCTNSKLQQVDLNILRNAKITSTSGSVYTINFEKIESFCGGLICKDNLNILLYENTKCPFVEYNYTNSFAMLRYQSKQLCDDSSEGYRIEFQLKCNLELYTPTIFKESKCEVIVQYPVSELCSIFNVTQKAESTGVLIGVIVLVVVTVILITGFIIYRRKKNAVYANINKSSTRIYTRDMCD